MAEEIVQAVKCLPCKHEGTTLLSRKHIKLSVVVCTVISVLEAGTVDPQGLLAAQSSLLGELWVSG